MGDKRLQAPHPQFMRDPCGTGEGDGWGLKGQQNAELAAPLARCQGGDIWVTAG